MQKIQKNKSLKKYYAAALLLILHASNISAQDQTESLPNNSNKLIEIRQAGSHSLRITMKPETHSGYLPDHPALVRLGHIDADYRFTLNQEDQQADYQTLSAEIMSYPPGIRILNQHGKLVQEITFINNGGFSFQVDSGPILGMGEGGPRPERGSDWRSLPVEFDRKGRLHNMQPRWQGNAYGSRNPVPLLIGTRGWAIYVNAPWGKFDLTDPDKGMFIPVEYAQADTMVQDQKNQQMNRGKGIPPMDTSFNNVLDIFIFDASDPGILMNEFSDLFGHAVIPPKWSLGYMQSHRTLEDDSQMIAVVDSFRAKRFPLDAVIYLGTGFCPRGWNTMQPSFNFNPEVFNRDPAEVISDLHDRNVKVIVHMVPWDRDRLHTLHGTIPPKPSEVLNGSHILNYWKQHEELINKGIDAFWPDEGDWFNLFERIKRHQLYYQGPLSSKPGIRPWSLHRNGFAGIGKWGGWVWSGDTESSWKTLEAQIAVGLNHSLSLSPYWGSDIGGFYPSDLTGELYTRWFQFGAFSPSFRSHGRTWWTRLPWGWGLQEMGPVESRTIPPESELNNPEIEPICKTYAELRYRLMPYTYSLAWEAHNTGMPLMRALWMHYPDDEEAVGLGNQYLWGKDILVAPVFEKAATKRKVYLPKGIWYDWWTGDKIKGGDHFVKEVTLSVMPIFVRAGAIIPMDPVKQFTDEPINEPMHLVIFPGDDGEFILYEDDGKSLDYIQGKASATKLSWNDKQKVLTIKSGDEGLSGNFYQNEFIVELSPGGEIKNILYNGRETRINF